MDLGLKGRVALITGANRGTGQIIAKTLAAEGATVLVQGPDGDSLQETLGLIPGAIPLAGDVTNDDGAAAVEDALKTSGLTPAILINNLGGADRGRWGKLTSEDWHRLYDHNVLSAVRMIDLVLPGMKDTAAADPFGGRIIALGTIGSTSPNKVMPHYYAAKGALATLTQSLAKELAGANITVNTVSPGLIKTDEVVAAFTQRAEKRGDATDWQSIEKQIADSQFPNPMGRVATREEVAALTVYLCSHQARFINGQNMRIDGGAIGVVE